jgi:hypothetical protein
LKQVNGEETAREKSRGEQICAQTDPRLRRLPARNLFCELYQAKGGFMSPQNIPRSDDRIEKLIIVLGQRMNALNKTLQLIAANLQGVESHLRQMAISSNPAPNYQRPLSEYPTFDWPSIGAMVLSQDEDGATSVEWSGQVFTRRSPSNKFQCAIWFSRHLGQDADGNKRYARLITFRDLNDAEPIAAKAKKAIRT